jgi:hypothetical protein
MGKAGFRKSDLARALRVAKHEGFQITRIEFSGDKIILYVAGEDGSVKESALDEWLNACKAQGH